MLAWIFVAFAGSFLLEQLVPDCGCTQVRCDWLVLIRGDCVTG